MFNFYQGYFMLFTLYMSVSHFFPYHCLLLSVVLMFWSAYLMFKGIDFIFLSADLIFLLKFDVL